MEDYSLRRENLQTMTRTFMTREKKELRLIIPAYLGKKIRNE